MLIRFGEIYDNTEVLSPIDRDTWEHIAETCKIGPQSRALELASGKGAFALHLARKYGCRIDGFDINPEFIEYSNQRASELGLTSRVRFACRDVNSLVGEEAAYDLGVSLGALYMFRDAGWRVLMRSVKPQGFVVVSDLFCKKNPPPKELAEVFFEEEEGGALTLEETRRRYTTHGMKVVGEAECTQKAWMDYYDLTRGMLNVLGKKYASDGERHVEIEEALREDNLFRKHGEEYIGYMTFIMQKA